MAWLHPGLLWLLAAVPAAAGLYLWAAYRRRQARRAFGDAPLVARLAAAVSPRRRRWKAALMVAAVALVALALAGPRAGTRLREVRREGIDLVVALDVSLSMQAQDVAPSRFERARNEVRKLLGTLRGDRVALVLFSGDAFIQCPLTTDYHAVRLFLDAARPGSLPTPGTDFGAALQMAVRAFDTGGAVRPGERRSRALLLVSDGENHAGDPRDFLDTARKAGIVVYAAGVGETAGAPIPLGPQDGVGGYKQDRAGQIVTTRLEEASLRSLAADGAYFRIARTSSTLPEIVGALERLDRTELAVDRFEDYAEFYQWPLALALALLLVESLVADRARARATAGDVT